MYVIWIQLTCYKIIFFNFAGDIEIDIKPCARTPCGINAICGNNSCSCIPGYHGDPYSECRPECTINEDCPKHRSCKNYKCIDPCIQTCGVNAVCTVYNHLAICECPKPLHGDAFVTCHRQIGTIFSYICQSVKITLIGKIKTHNIAPIL